MAQITLNSTGVASSGALVLQSNGTTAAVTIDTSQRAAFVAGTAALPSITTTGDTNTGIFFPAADTIAFAEGGVECARFDSAGNFGLGNTNPASYNSAADNLVIGTLGNNGMTIVSGSTSSGYIMFADGTTGQQAYEGQITYDHTNNFMALNTNGTERARIDSSGNLLVGTTSTGGTVGNEKQIVGGIINTLSGFNSITTSPTTVATLPSRDGATYLFTAQNVSDANTTSYGVVSIITQQGTALVKTDLQTASFSTITISSLDVRITSSLGTKTYKWSLVRIM